MTCPRRRRETLRRGPKAFGRRHRDVIQEGLRKFEESLPHWHKVGDRRAEAITLSFIGKIYDALGEKQRAMDYYNRTCLSA